MTSDLAITGVMTDLMKCFNVFTEEFQELPVLFSKIINQMTDLRQIGLKTC